MLIAKFTEKNTRKLQSLKQLVEDAMSVCNADMVGGRTVQNIEAANVLRK
jgi:hypothetical protein